ncbi:MAG: hypothetical protein SZ59_C0003G0004 [candidate division TM6 bacterium GW2011_GWF2_28_16]|nr:MAG: hypothetical protein SZ59_C0003G0004 [candidate division TM6 bacterium GW2011_GWF2_28_16]
MFKHISELLNSFVLPQDQWKIKLFNNWDKVLGSLADKVVILKAERHMLILGVTHPAWAHEMFMLSDVLREKINLLLGKEQIKYIRFQVIKKPVKEQNNINNINLSENLNNKINKNKNFSLNRQEYASLTQIKDLELKEVLKEFYFKSKKGV